jgi:hypothetical protein
MGGACSMFRREHKSMKLSVECDSLTHSVAELHYVSQFLVNLRF